jgi:ubiquinone/menaquinone biosynthesis C-methylase UbiE
MNSKNYITPENKHVCPWWLAYTFDNPVRRWLHDPEKLFSLYLRNNMIAVDIGCGMGVFSIGMAKMVGDGGRVISVDLQQEMLDITRKRAEKYGVAHRITLGKVEQGVIGVSEPADFILAFWMVHEVEDILRFFHQVLAFLKPSGVFLIAEPKMHVSYRAFQEMLSQAQKAGFKIHDIPSIRFSYAVTLRK